MSLTDIIKIHRKSGLSDINAIKLWKKENPDKAKINDKKWRKLNSDKVNSNNKKHRHTHPDRIRICNKSYKNKNQTKIKVRDELYRELNIEKIKAKNKIYRELNREKIKSLNRAYRKANPGKINAKTAKRRAVKLQATPKWLTKEHWKEIEDFYVLAQELAWLNQDGKSFHVDHITPLQGENICGLHVPWNLQLLPAKENISKGNR